MPYHAARAIAATFCHDIRWALTPVFGNDFPSTCLHPKDPCFAKFLIDPDIVKYCAQETVRFKELGPAYTVFGSDASSLVEATKTHCRPSSLNEKAAKQHVQPADIESGYGTDTDRNGKYLCSPEVSPRTQFTPINRSQSPYSPSTAVSSLMGSPINLHAPPGLLTPTSAPCEYQSGIFRTKRTHSNVASHEDYVDEALTRSETAATIDSAHGSEVEMSGGDDNHTHDDLNAAAMLLSFRAMETTIPPTKRTRRGSRF
jgi:hypothetical protein